jgi:hypothetical protein
MRLHLHISASVIAVVLISSGSAYAQACNSNGLRSAPPSTGKATPVNIYNNTNGVTSLLRIDGMGNLRVESTIEPMGMGTVMLYRGELVAAEASLDGAPACAGTVAVTGPGECHVSLDQDAEQFYLSPEGQCELR